MERALWCNDCDDKSLEERERERDIIYFILRFYKNNNNRVQLIK